MKGEYSIQLKHTALVKQLLAIFTSLNAMLSEAQSHNTKVSIIYIKNIWSTCYKCGVSEELQIRKEKL